MCKRVYLKAKDLACFNKPCCGKQTKNLEIRWCDDLLEAYDRAERIRDRYYKNGE